MSNTKVQYVCSQCGGTSLKWAGQCGDCLAWNSLTEMALLAKNTQLSPRLRGYAGADTPSIIDLQDVTTNHEIRWTTGLEELDRVLGGGLVEGSVVLIGGDPGIGKSTLLLQTAANLANDFNTLYVTGEESLKQVSLRAKRLGVDKAKIKLLAETQVEKILMLAEKNGPKVLIIDSIQTLYTEVIQSAPGSVSQVRESAAYLVRYAKRTGTSIFIVGHVTKDGSLAGPRVLEHMVDAVLYFEGEKDSRFRVVRAFKNRFGAVNELGLFAMTDKGLKAVNNPSAIFLSRDNSLVVAGSNILVSWEGNRPLLIEVQALVDETPLANPRRVTVGFENNRLGMLLAVLNRHAGISIHSLDVFINVVGGVRITETGIDLAVLFAMVSSLRNKPLSQDLVVFGEIGLGGEIRPVQGGQERIREAQKHGFKTAIVPKANMPKKGAISDIEVIGVNSLQEALTYL